MVMPKQKPGRSEQVVCTPVEFLAAVKKRLGIEGYGFGLDLAASHANAVAGNYYTEEDDSLIQSWHGANARGTWSWCNPPYADLRPWVAKAHFEASQGAMVAMLVAASVGSEWWREFVDGSAYVTFFGPRLTFVGHTSPYPKDLALLLYAPFLRGGSTIWRWK